MKHLLLSVFALSSLLAFAGERMSVWPEGRMPDPQPHQLAALTNEIKQPGFVTNDFRVAYLDWCEKPAKPNGGTVIMISGGSYQCCCDIGLVCKAWPKFFTDLGFQCVNFVYRTPRPVGLPIYQSAWEDGQRAVRLVRREAAKRGLNPENIGVVSMSAGSHLATLLATSSETPAYAPVDELDKVPCHVNWAITGAIAYGLSTSADGRRDDNAGVGGRLMPEFKFDAKTAPMCMLHGGKDVYSPLSSTQVYRQLRRMKVPAELHLWSDRDHGGFWADNWRECAFGFIRQLNLDGKLAEGKAQHLLFRYPNEDSRVLAKKADLWPEGKMPDAQAHQCTPYLEWHLPREIKTKAIQIIYSGGGYNNDNPDNFEVAPFRRFLNEKGMAVVTVKYRVPRPKNLPKHQSAWEDLQRAIRLVRSEAPAYGLDPDRLGIMGSSAGGHLTLMGALSSTKNAYEPIDDIDRLPCNVQWAVGIYPAYALTDGVDGRNTNGGNGDEDTFVPEFAFDANTCPMVFLHGDDDICASMASVKVWEKMREMGIQSDLHTFAKRGHCFQAKAAEGTGSYTWMNRIWEFLVHKGFNR